MKVYRAVIEYRDSYDDPISTFDAMFLTRDAAQAVLDNQKAKLGPDWERYGDGDFFRGDDDEYWAHITVDFIYESAAEYEAETARRRSETLARLTGGKSC